MDKIELGKVAEYITEKISVDEVRIEDYISTENMLPNKGGICLASNKPATGKVTRYQKGDILTSNIRPYFKKIWLADRDGGCSNDVLVIRNKQGYLPYYLYYVLSEDKFFDYSTASAKGTKMPRGDKTAIMQYLVPKYAIDIQERIIEILKNIDKKIQVNSKLNANLVLLSQNLYNQWFVDFEYPIGDSESYKTSGGAFVESELGNIPLGWSIRQLSDVSQCQNGRAFYKEGYDSEGAMVIDLGNVDVNGNFIYTNADKFISMERYDNAKLEKYRVFKDDLIMVMTDRKSTMDLLGKTGKVYRNTPFLLNQRMYRIRSLINTNYLYTTLNSKRVLDSLKERALGSVQKYVNTGDINSLNILVAPDSIMNKFSEIVDPIFKAIEVRLEENERLNILRDSLLPKLMSGEMELSDIEI